MILRPIPGFEDRYSITESGEIWAHDRTKLKGGRNWKGRWMKSHLTSRGYPCVCLYSSTGKKTFSVHRLVCLTWIPNKESKPEVNHKDGNKINNHVSNLEWVDESQNNKHAWATGLNHSTKKHKEQSRKNIQIAIDRQTKYPWHKISVGESFVLNSKQPATNVWGINRKHHPKRFEIRRDSSGIVHVFRVA